MITTKTELQEQRKKNNLQTIKEFFYRVRNDQKELDNPIDEELIEFILRHRKNMIAEVKTLTEALNNLHLECQSEKELKKLFCTQESITVPSNLSLLNTDKSFQIHAKLNNNEYFTRGGEINIFIPKKAPDDWEGQATCKIYIKSCDEKIILHDEVEFFNGKITNFNFYKINTLMAALHKAKLVLIKNLDKSIQVPENAHVTKVHETEITSFEGTLPL